MGLQDVEGPLCRSDAASAMTLRGYSIGFGRASAGGGRRAWTAAHGPPAHGPASPAHRSFRLSPVAGTGGVGCAAPSIDRGVSRMDLDLRPPAALEWPEHASARLDGWLSRLRQTSGMLRPSALPSLLMICAAPAVAKDRTPPHLAIDESVLNNIVVIAPTQKPTLVITQTIESPPVSLVEVTKGLVSGVAGKSAPDRGAAADVQADLNRATRMLQVPHWSAERLGPPPQR